MTRPRALVVATTYPARSGDGTPAFVADLCAELAREFDVTVVVPAVPGGAPRETMADGTLTVVRHRYFLRRWEDVAAGAILENVRSRKSRLLQVPFLLVSQRMAVRRAAREFTPDVIHAHWIIPAGVSARGLAKRVPLVVTTLGGDLYALRGRFPTWLKRRVMAAVAVVTVMNEDMAARAKELGARDVRVMPMGARFSPVARSQDGESGPLRLLAVGRLVDKKGFDVLLAALAAVPHATLTIVGDGPSRGTLEAAAAGLPVTFAGQLGREDLDAQLRDASVAIFPSRRAASGDQDGLPVAMLEAMGSGLTVIASDLPGLNEAVTHDVTGLLVAPDDPDALASALARLAGDPSLRTRLGAAARERAGSYSLEAVGVGYRALLKDVIG
jgi:colanic acid/amylovoran biosynthesis glycosyltransferase